MSTQIIALIVVVLSFSVLFAWVFWPSNRERFENLGKLILDSEEDEAGSAETANGEKS